MLKTPLSVVRAIRCTSRVLVAPRSSGETRECAVVSLFVDTTFMARKKVSMTSDALRGGPSPFQLEGQEYYLAECLRVCEYSEQCSRWHPWLARLTESLVAAHWSIEKTACVVLLRALSGNLRCSLGEYKRWQPEVCQYPGGSSRHMLSKIIRSKSSKKCIIMLLDVLCNQY